LENSIVIGGFGGQGVLFLGKILAHAGMLEGKEVTWFPSYGAEMRGGTANCTVVISDELIGSPVITQPDMLVAMSDASLKKFHQKIRTGGALFLDSSLISNKEDLRKDIQIFAVPATEIARRLGNTKSANMVLLGSLIARAGILGKLSVYKALESSMPDNKRDLLAGNKSALAEGMKYVENKKS
jgi:2-oxoglutarate ferredoxin oxidoreductase subunit gamma